MSREWKEVRLGDVIEFNPSEAIKKGTISKKVGMEMLNPFQRKIEGFEVTEYKSGTKFRNGDTLLARITPCLENGKTAQVTILDDNEIGFGSTEFIVLRQKPKHIVNDFIYYLAISPMIRETAIKSMTGTSGRQRAQKDVIENTLFKLPPLEEQKAIANILSTLDKKIEINNQINKKLEEMAQTIFKHWFVDFEFPNENGEPYKSGGGEMVVSELGMIPKGWEVIELSKLVDIIDNRGKTPPQENEKTIYPILDVKALSGDGRIIDYENCMKYVSKETYDSWFRSGHPKEGDILLSTVGSLAEMKIFYGSIGCIAQNVVALRCNNVSNLYMYQYLKYIKNDLISYNIGSVQPSIKITHIIKHKILKSDIETEKKFDKLISDISKLIYKNHLQSSSIKDLRDTLLPKLMSGELRVPLEEGDIS